MSAHTFECTDDSCTGCGGNPYDGMTDRELLIAVLVELKSVRQEHAETVQRVGDVLDNLAPHLEAVGPMIEALAANPMFRMLAGGKKKTA